MRLTADNMNAALSGTLEIRLDGRELEGVIVADEEAGLVVLLCRDASGNAYRHAGANGRFAVKTLRGRVEISLPPNATPDAVAAFEGARKAERLAALAASLDHTRRRPAGRRPTR